MVGGLVQRCRMTGCWRRVGVVWTVGLAACGSTPTAPSSSTPAASSSAFTVTVSGISPLAVGQAIAFTARTSAAPDVTGQSVWASSDATVATVSPTGFVTGIGVGVAKISAAYQGVTGTLQISVFQATTPSPTVAACGTIVTPGAYVLANDLPPAVSGTCLKILTSGVQLDCRNHTVPSLSVSGVNNVSIANCTVSTASALSLTRTMMVTFDHNTLVGGLLASASQYLTLSNNHSSGAGATLATTSAAATNNTFDALTPPFSAAIYLIEGGNNQVLQNTIDGGYDGKGGQVGEDDGIELVDESNDTVQGNTIRNVFDAGIEGADAVAASVIANNTIVNAGYAGIGSYWCTNWSGNAITGNSVSRSPSLVTFFFSASTTYCVNASTPGGFSNNQITGNRFRTATIGGYNSLTNRI